MTEYLAENSRLRQLSRRYAEGQLGFGDYRSARREILEALEAGRIAAQGGTDTAEVEVVSAEDEFSRTDMRLPDDSTVFYKTMPPRVLVPEAPEAVMPAESASSWDSHTQVLAIVLTVSLLIALGALIYVFVL